MILMRHGETVFNLVFGTTRVDPGVHDPALTPLGRAQAAEAATALATEDVRRIITSPYRRALETSDIIARALGVPLTVEPLVRERAKFACDVGTPRTAMMRRWHGLALDHLDELWWSETEEAPAMLEARCRAFCRVMAGTPDWPHVAVITHWGVIRTLTGRRALNGERIRYDPRAAP